MAPAGRKRRRTHYRKRLLQSKKTKESSNEFHSISTAASTATEAGLNTEIPNSICSTPKGQKFRIPELLSCPPAPKKKRRLTLGCSSQNSTVSFFRPPDLEMFFLLALHDISV
ncbi:cyclin-dependent protein kinase inhibitor SMR9-like protein [Cinnamomum micranthum f. kanehirae]|uniref:Cyclin-dependent protein kinase inhibitor SMR9-like protein n=1 Tax=Cinnamomum micranthum f. kanehirae TaxID=337451 RepID=A0A443N2E1_9MAGN|nr:cyclin-dependent protein kinase inhibitor SMR9-like protein [Cinnamomum micranthum f. kanehirae]